MKRGDKLRLSSFGKTGGGNKYPSFTLAQSSSKFLDFGCLYIVPFLPSLYLDGQFDVNDIVDNHDSPGWVFSIGLIKGA